jgi:hypothetical protein
MRAREGKSASCVMGFRLIIALTVLSLAGCGIVTHQDVMVEMTAVQEEIAEALEAVTSVEQAKEAAPTIEFLVMKWKLLQVRAREQGNPSKFEKESLDVEALADQLKKIRIKRELLQKDNEIWPELEVVLQHYDAAMALPTEEKEPHSNEHSDEPGEGEGPAGG